MPTVLFFYCKHGNIERDKFIPLARSLLAQFLKQDNAFLHFFYQKCCESVESVLNSPAEIRKLLVLAFQNCRSAYIILDGIDECPRQERKAITQWFRNLVEDLPTSHPERLRCLFVSQDDGIARKDFSGLASFKMEEEDNKHDIEEYSRVEATKLQEIFSLSAERASAIAAEVASSAGGEIHVPRVASWLELLKPH